MPKRKNRKTNVKRSYGHQTTSKFQKHEGDTLEDSSLFDLEDVYSHALTEPDHFPENMIKYWRQRRSLFTLFDGSSITGQLPLLDQESWYSVTPEPIAARIAQRCRCGIVLDAFCGVGGNAIQFALTCEKVIAIDIDPIKLKMAKHNARVYGVEQFITFLQGDWHEFANAWIRNRDMSASDSDLQADTVRWQGCQKLNFDVVFLSPPWGGVSYRTFQSHSKQSPQKNQQIPSIAAPATPSIEEMEEKDDCDENFYPLSALAPSGGKCLYETAKRITSNVCMFVPRTVDLNELASLVDEDERSNEFDEQICRISIEEQWLRGRCKAMSCYFGELADWKDEDDF